MHHRALLFLALAAILEGCVRADFISTTTQYTLNNGSININKTELTPSYGGPFGWKLSWHLIGGDRASFGPLSFRYNGAAIGGSELFSPQRSQNDNSSWSEETHSAMFDPCVNRIPEDQLIETSFHGSTNAIDGTLNVTTYVSTLDTVSADYNPASIYLDCNIIDCSKYVLLNVTTDLKNYSVVVTLRSGINVRATVAVGPSQCPSSTGANEPSNYDLTPGYNQTITVNGSRSEIWFLLSNFTVSGLVDQDQVSIQWKVLSGDTPSGLSEQEKEIIKWALIGTAIGAAVIVTIIVIVVVVRKKRGGYTQVQ
jgi:hypothetical protein